MTDPRRATPRTDVVLADPRLRAAADRVGRQLVKQAVRTALDRCRAGEIAPEEVVDEACRHVPAVATSLRDVVNATGVLVHTNLGRAPLSKSAVDAMVMAAGSTNIECDLATGRRASRGRSAIQALKSAVPQAAAVHVVNNGAAALALTACALASGRAIVVARGELVEIGNGFRIPELLESVGANLREVGTTNRVHLRDYAEAIDERTGFVLKVHPSNFVVRGFTSSVSIEELATLPALVIADTGSGLLHPHPRLPDEPSASSALTAGADLVTASGDKLLGGPQCGLVLGRQDLVERLRSFPLARAMRVDKLTLAALEATIVGPPPPVAVALSATSRGLMARAEALAEQLAHMIEVSVVATSAAVGGGGAPGVTLPSAAVALSADLASPLRIGQPSVMGRVSGDRLLIDLFGVPPEKDELIVRAIAGACRSRRTA